MAKSKKSGLVIFLHIAKTGGSTAQSVLGRRYRGSILRIPNAKTSYRDAAILYASSPEPYLIIGHLNISESIDIENCTRLTYLREPVARVLSHYYYLKMEGTIQDVYAAKIKKDMDNCLVRALSGKHLETAFGEVNQAHYELALQNLTERFDFFGLTEYYDESLILLSDVVRTGPLVYRKKNITSVKKQTPAETIAFIKNANKWDMMLYAEAKKIFIERMNAMQWNQKVRLAALRALNRLAALIPG